MSDTNYPKAVISTSEGDLTVELWNDVAPGHVDNFLTLGRDGFYNDLIFHRIIPNFVIQGGCPNGLGNGDAGKKIKAEFNDRKHDKGVLSMARSQHPDSAGSQFFICLGRDHCQHLDGQYTAFGKVIEGEDVIDKLADRETGAGDRPYDPPKMKHVTPLDDAN